MSEADSDYPDELLIADQINEIELGETVTVEGEEYTVTNRVWGNSMGPNFVLEGESDDRLMLNSIIRPGEKREYGWVLVRYHDVNLNSIETNMEDG